MCYIRGEQPYKKIKNISVLGEATGRTNTNGKAGKLHC